jgi:hypothetical protein
VTAPSGRRPAISGRGMKMLLLAAVALVVAGCGLSEYERRMGEEEDRLQYFDLEVKNLDDALVLPPKKEGKKEIAPPDVFIRAPKGIRSVAEDSMYAGMLYRYARSGSATGSPFVEVLLAAAESKKNFRNDVLRVFPGVDPTHGKRVTKPSPGRTPLQFDSWASEDNLTLTYFYFHERGSMQVVVVYRVDKARTGGTTQTQIDMSLASLAVPPEAGRARAIYRSQSKKPPSGKS